MAGWNRSSGLEDPLQVYSGLSLFPRTLKSLSNQLPPPRLHQSEDLQQTHRLLESMPLHFQNELLGQAKAILDSRSELLNPGIPTNVVSEDESQGIEINPIANQRERRQGLGRKRARFSLKPATSGSQPTPNVEPSFDDSKYHNPEDFFAAYEKFENAKREWQKQTGNSLTDTHQDQPTIRPRRPGISGRRRVTYNHRYSTDGINLEASDGEISSPSDQSLLKNNRANVTTVDGESTDPTTEIEKNVDSILGELLSCSPELVGDVNLLEERLQIKPVDTEKLSLPELQDVRKSDFLAPQKYSSKPRTVLSDIRNMLKGIHSETARKNTQTPSPLQSPGDSLSSHIKHMSPSNLQDHFSFPDSNHLLPGDISTKALGQQSSEVDAAKDSNIYSRSSTTISVGIDNVFPANVGSGGVGPVNKSMEKTSGELECDTHTDISRPASSSAERTFGDGMDDSVTDRNPIRSKLNVDIQSEANDGGIVISESQTYRDLIRRENDPDICAGEANQFDGLAEDSFRGAARSDDFTVEKDIIPSQQDESSKSPNGAQEQNNTVNGPSEYVENLQEHWDQNENHGAANGLQEENAQQGARHSSEEQMTKGGRRISHERKGKKRNKKGSGESEGNKRMKTSSREGGRTEQTETISHQNKESKQSKTVSRESKAFSRRKSLAGAGTKWESGVRRSMRIKSRPLEYWKGERFLYGRIHESLATVIGIKYESPTAAGKGNGEKPRLKVKSYVSNEYKELIDRAALH